MVQAIYVLVNQAYNERIQIRYFEVLFGITNTIQYI